MTLDGAGPSIASVVCPTHKAGMELEHNYSSIAYRTQRNTRIDSSSIPVLFALCRKTYTLVTLGPASYCEPALMQEF